MTVMPVWSRKVLTLFSMMSPSVESRVETWISTLLLTAGALAVVGAAVYALLFALFRVSSIGSLAGGISALVVTWVRQRPLEYQILTAVLFALILYTHRGNIGRLLKRTERSL